jgi:hypothetical protein
VFRWPGSRDCRPRITHRLLDACSPVSSRTSPISLRCTRTAACGRDTCGRGAARCMAAAGPRPWENAGGGDVPGPLPLLRLDEPSDVDTGCSAGCLPGARVPGAAGVSAARVTLRGWTVELRAALADLGAARLRWCLLCGRVGLWGWHPLTPSMPITWVCTDQPSCWQRQAAVAARTRRRWRRNQARDGRAGPGTRGWAGPYPSPWSPATRRWPAQLRKQARRRQR